MARRWTLVAVASTQLAAQLAGHVVALRRGRHFDVPFIKGDPEHLVRDWLWFGTAYSAPPYLLGPHIWAIGQLGRGRDDRARWVLEWLGAGLTLGYLSERCSRVRVRPGGVDPIETPIVVCGWGCAVGMALLAAAWRSQTEAKIDRRFSGVRAALDDTGVATSRTGGELRD
jgi:hypothetical protein